MLSPTPPFFMNSPLGCGGGRGSFCREAPPFLGGSLITNRESLVCEVSLSPAPRLAGGSQELGDLKRNFLCLFHFLLGAVESNKQGGWQGPDRLGRWGMGRGKLSPMHSSAICLDPGLQVNSLGMGNLINQCPALLPISRTSQR